tara:strand:- start:4864 stop:5337 length:474 start_codon:yes stop_codon:yes gene_type:complete
MSILQNSGIVQKKFDKQTYSITLLDADEGWDVGMGVFKLLATPLARGYDDGAFGDVQEYDFATNIAMALTSTLDRVPVKELMRSLLDSLRIDDQPVDFNKHFRGKYAHLITVTIWAFKENFSDFPSGFQIDGQDGVSEILTLLQKQPISPEEENKEQ